MVWRLQFSCLQLSGKGGLGSGGFRAGLELQCAEVCVCQHALVSALTGLGGSAWIFSTLRHILLLTIATCCCLEDTISLKNQSCLNIFFLNK